MDKKKIDFEVNVSPSSETMAMVLALLNVWQKANPDLMVALVPDREKYCYEIIRRGEKKNG